MMEGALHRMPLPCASASLLLTMPCWVCVFCYTMQDLQRRLDLSKLEAETFSAQSKGKDDKIADLEAR